MRDRIPLPLVLLIAAALTAGSLLAGSTPIPPKTEKRLVKVMGNQAWKDTGLFVQKSDLVIIKATGKVYFSNGAEDSGVGPLGWSRSNYQSAWPDDWLLCDDPLPSAGHAGLLARIGKEEIFVGASKTFKGKLGKLYLGINDCSLTGDFYNTGHFNAVVQVKHPPKR